MQYGEFGFLNFGLVLLGAAVLSVPIARRLGLSAIVAYLIAGIIIGPYGIAVFGTPESIIPVSELGVVMLLFLIGLELELGRLLAMRRVRTSVTSGPSSNPNLIYSDLFRSVDL